MGKLHIKGYDVPNLSLSNSVSCTPKLIYLLVLIIIVRCISSVHFIPWASLLDNEASESFFCAFFFGLPSVTDRNTTNNELLMSHVALYWKANKAASLIYCKEKTNQKEPNKGLLQHLCDSVTLIEEVLTFFLFCFPFFQVPTSCV